MRIISRANRLGILTLCLCGVARGQTATVSLEVEAVNGVLIPGGPVSAIEAAPGDVLQLVFRARGWGSVQPPRVLGAYQCTMRFEEYFNDCAGNVLPVLFYELTDPDHDCPKEELGIGNNPNAYLDCSRPDFVFLGTCPFWSPFASTCTYFWVGVTFGAPVVDPGIRRYLGSLRVRVSGDAKGTFVLDPYLNSEDPALTTVLLDHDELPIEPLAIEPCTIIVPDGHLVLADTDPPTGGIDARQPHPIEDPKSVQGWDRIAIQIVPPVCDDHLMITAADFSVFVEPPGGDVLEIVDVIYDGESVTLLFDGTIPPGRWTRIIYEPNGSDACLGFLPGDVNNDRKANALDILKIIDDLNGIENYAVHQTDIDRSGVSNPADILRVIDLLNGANSFEPWNGRSLPPNPCF